MKKRMISACMACLLSIALLAGCGGAKAQTADQDRPQEAQETGSSGEEESREGIQVVASIFPAYDWARNVIGSTEGAELTLLVDSGVDLHSYQPSVEDILTISNCDVFIYVGGESDGWASDALAQAANQDMVVVNLLEALGEGAREEETVEGMEAEEEEEEEGAYDEHVWLSLKNAMTLSGAIEEALSRTDPDHAEAYRANLAAYQDKLSALDSAYAAAVQEAPNKTLVFGDRFPFLYLVKDYGLDYFAAFSGCSAETEASFETILFLAEKTDSLGLHAVMTIDGSDGKIAKTIAETASSDLEILALDSMQSITAEDMAGGADYLTMMENNLEVLKKALQ